MRKMGACPSCDNEGLIRRTNSQEFVETNTSRNAIAAEIDRTLDNLKNVLDRLILQFQADHPAYTTAYATARKIVNSGNSHATPAPTPPTP